MQSMPAHIERLLEPMVADDSTDEDVFQALLAARRACKNASEKESVDDFFGDVAVFFTDSDYRPLAAFAQTAARRRQGDELRDQLMERTNGDLEGVELATPGNDRFAIFLQDASEPGRVRVSYFDARGFFGHATRDTYEEVFKEAWADGFREEAHGNLEALINTEAFIAGNEFTTKVMRVNAGEPWEVVFPLQGQNAASTHEEDQVFGQEADPLSAPDALVKPAAVLGG